jgi:hypothetical protein
MVGKRSGMVSVLLTLIALWSEGLGLLAYRRVVGFTPSSYPFLMSIFISLTLLGLAAIVQWSSSNQDEWISLWQWLLLNLVFWLVPSVFGYLVPGGPHSYEFFGFSDYIIRNGHIKPDADRLIYHNWPVFFIEVALFMQVLGVGKPDVLVRWAPFIFQCFFLAGLYLFFRNTLRREYRWSALWIFSLGNWQQQNALLPQAYALVLFFLVLAVLSGPGSLGETSLTSSLTPSRLSIAFLLLGATATSHPLTSLAALGIVVALCVVTYYRVSTFALTAILVVSAWFIYGSAPFFHTNIATYVGLLLRFMGGMKEAFASVTVGRLLAGSEWHREIVGLRLALTGIVLSIDLVGAAWTLRVRPVQRSDAIVLGFTIGVLAVAPTAAVLTGGILSRLYTLVIPAAAYFGSRYLDTGHVKWFIALFLILGGPLHFVAQEGNQVSDYVPRGYVSGLYFFDQHVPMGAVTEVRSVAQSDPPAFGGFQNRERYREVHYWWPRWQHILSVISGGRSAGVSLPYYLVFADPLDAAVIDFATGDSSVFPRIKVAIADSLRSCVYMNGTLDIIDLSHVLPSWK